MAESQTMNGTATSFDLFAGLESTNHEQIVLCQDNATGLKAIIASHNTLQRLKNTEREYDTCTDCMKMSSHNTLMIFSHKDYPSYL